MKPNPIDMKNDILNFWNASQNGANKAQENDRVDKLAERQLELGQQLAQTLSIVQQMRNELTELKYKLSEDEEEQVASTLELKKPKSMELIYREHTDAKEAWNKSKRGTKPTLVALWEDWKIHGHEIDAYPRFNYLFENGFMTFEDYQIWKQGRQG